MSHFLQTPARFDPSHKRLHDLILANGHPPPPRILSAAERTSLKHRTRAFQAPQNFITGLQRTELSQLVGSLKASESFSFGLDYICLPVHGSRFHVLELQFALTVPTYVVFDFILPLTTHCINDRTPVSSYPISQRLCSTVARTC